VRLRVILDSLREDPALDTALSRALMRRVAGGELPETLRLARPGTMVAFAKRDALSPGYAEAVAAARGHGFEPVLRLAGGRAAVFHDGSIELAHAVPDREPREGIHARFASTSELIARALRALGVDARVGEVPGEYCPGRYSVSAGGRRKLVGIGQRLIRGGSHTGAVIVVSGADRVREVLVPVYRALDLDWDPAATGEVAAEAVVDWLAVRDAVLAEYGRRYELEEARLDEDTLALARALAHEHRAAVAA
jgi:octanoyl-[GcvH]:protein N-octanoyltransferase